ncbi:MULTISPECIES: phosphatase PAP2 family protein [Nguyenibacter]|uniref:Phosphatase PAP2 family protein n=1 Tax=Nguyenibacter vanlangensis TaxID=1216886 RepID=A0A7Y7IX54_9PROT|nr:MULTISPECIES: phosphatase PAP2 family protein [Nguyenibacter]NVN11954.1 phosphatase PAP2 family protein [Nguyenibacter vanlangensis]WRH88694.1 phosphatase PAP2 family protein [Nguyenibacter sp. L1]
MMHFITDFADQDVIIPLQVAVLLTLLLLRRWRFALAWCLVTGGGSALILVLKLGFEACGPGAHRVLYSPSGHTMAGTVVYGGLLGLLDIRRSVLMLATAGIAGLLGVSRIACGCHTVAEVLVAGILGTMATAFLYRLAGSPPRFTAGPTLGVLAVVLCVVAVFHGHHAAVEQQVERISHIAVGPLLCRPHPDLIQPA